MPDRVVIVVYEGAQSLDVFGPAEVFAATRRQIGNGAHEVVLASTRGGLISVTAATSIMTKRLDTIRPRASDSVLVVGGEESEVRAAIADEALSSWLLRAARVVRRLGSICSGAFVLAAVGLLDGRRCATHWSACDRLAALFDRVDVDREAIFVVDGKLWTSAGVTTGIDMALAMVEEDHGRAVADAVAARLVLYARRPGFQSQFSDALVAQQRTSDPLGPTLAWAKRNLRTVDVESLAQRAGASVRTLHRQTAKVFSLTPAKLIEKLRVEEARTLLSSTGLLQKEVAFRCGFGDTARMQRALRRSYGVDGKALRLLFPGPKRRARSRAERDLRPRR